MKLDKDILESLVYTACKDMIDLGASKIVGSCDMGSFEKDIYYNLGFERTNDYIGYIIEI
ncbi:MAG: hypothetical protein GX300_00555 [Tissierellia bacterium]|nr:hypothetical protein [Tissierellia bacterium]